jgi:hypothetical protein
VWRILRHYTGQARVELAEAQRLRHNIRNVPGRCADGLTPR